LELEARRAKVVSKGGAVEYVYWASGTAHLPRPPRSSTGLISVRRRQLVATDSFDFRWFRNVYQLNLPVLAQPAVIPEPIKRGSALPGLDG
jgi:hypothetical protein